jgi:sugar/nucleoside kinase (ribokinase family)
MNDTRFDCLCTGIVVADHVCEPIDHLPQAGELVLTPRTTLSIGGCAANVAVCLARLGRRAAVVGRVGDDFFGRFVADSLRETGVDCRHLEACSDEATSCSMIVNVEGQDRRFIHARGANRLLAGNEISPSMLRETRVVYVGGYCLSEQPSPENVAALFQAARRAGVATVLDVVIPGAKDYWPFLAPVLPWTDVFLPNNDEGETMTGLHDPLAQARRFRECGATTVVVTCGAKGCVVASDKETFRAGRFAVDFVDGTGSGDAFAAGFIHGLLQEGDIRDCVRFGTALGASCVRTTGATAGVFTAAELNYFLRSRPLEMTPD